MPPEQNNNNSRVSKIEEFLLNPDKVVFQSIEELETAIKALTDTLGGVNIAELKRLQGVDGKTPVRGVDYFTDDDLNSIQEFILDRIPRVGFEVPSVEQVNDYIREAVAKVPRIKGDKGEKGEAGKDGKNGSPDTAEQIVEKLRSLDRNQRLKITDIRGLQNRMTVLAETADELEQLRQDFDNLKITVPVNLGSGGGGGGGTVNSVVGTTNRITINSADPANPIVDISSAYVGQASITTLGTITTGIWNGTDIPLSAGGTGASLTDPGADRILFWDDTAGAVTWLTIGTNLSITGTTLNATGGGGGGMTSFTLAGDSGTPQTIGDGNTATIAGGTGIDTVASATDTVTVNLDSASVASLAKADTAIQNLAGLGITATATELNYTTGVTSAIQTQLNNKQGLDATLTALAAYNTNGLLTQTAADTFTGRTITGTADQVTVTNGDGVAGNPTLSLPQSINTGASPQFAGLNVGHATDTTLARVSAGQISVEGVQVATASNTLTTTNKRNQPRTSSSTTASSLTPDLSVANVFYRTTQTATLTIEAPTGTPVIGETIAIYVDSAGAQTLTINSTFKPFGAAFPATTTAGKTFLLTAQYNGTDWKALWANAV